MSILITGGAGFVGSHLVEHLLAATDDKPLDMELLQAAAAERIAMRGAA